MLQSCTVPAFARESDSFPYNAINAALFSQLKDVRGFEKIEIEDAARFLSVALSIPQALCKGFFYGAVKAASDQGLLSDFPHNKPVAHGDKEFGAQFDRLMDFIAGEFAHNGEIRFAPQGGKSIVDLVNAARRTLEYAIRNYPDAEQPYATVIGTRLQRKGKEDQLSTTLLVSRDVLSSDRLQSDLLNKPKTLFPEHMLIKLVGPSGSGKTATALHKLGHTTFVLYLLGKHIAVDSDGEPVACIEAGRADADAVEAVVRNGHVRSRVMQLVQYELDLMLKSTRTESLLTLPASEPLTVRVVVDEVGDYPAVTRGLIAMHRHIRCDIAKMLKLLDPKSIRLAQAPPTDAQVQDTEAYLKLASRVHVFVVGTGTSQPEDPHGSARYASWYVVKSMGEHTEKFATHFRDKLPDLVKAKLKTSSANAAALYEALLENARLGALVSSWTTVLGSQEERFKVLKYPFPARTSDKADAEAAEFVIGLSATDGSQAFFALNGLCGLTGVKRRAALANAMAIDVGRYDAIEKATVRHQLLVSYGVLEDRAHPKAHFDMDGPEPRRVSGKEGALDALYVPNDGYGRYRMPASYRAMYLQQCLDELPQFHGGSDADGLEQLLWQWCAVLLSCATPEVSAVDLALELCAPYIVEPSTAAATTAAAAATRGRTFTKRLIDDAHVRHGEWISDAPSHHPGAVSCLRARTKFPFAKSGSLPKFTDDGELPPKMHAPHSELRDMATTHTAVSILNAAHAPYVDVAAFSTDGKQMTALWIQAKLRDAIDVMAVNEECAKMGLWKRPVTKNKDGETRSGAKGETAFEINARKWVGRMHREMGLPKGAGRFLVVVAGPNRPAAEVVDAMKSAPVDDDGRGKDSNIAASLVYFPTDTNGVLPKHEGSSPPPLYPLFMKRVKHHSM